nr:MAG TPA: hypothetical protein [Caudoviricetes sp.]
MSTQVCVTRITPGSWLLFDRGRPPIYAFDKASPVPLSVMRPP